MRWGLVVCVLVAVGLLAGSAAGSADALRCRPTPTDGFGPFTGAAPPVRAKIGTGHVLTGVVVSALDCRPLGRARVQFWMANAQGRYTRAGSATVITDKAGRFRFESWRPVAYEGRPGHIHIRVLAPGHLPLLTRYEPPVGTRRGGVRLVLQPDAL
jgi:protocatechuate 3,4-dioxygenase beta subunit